MSPKTFLSMICPDFARGQSQASLFNLSDIVIPNEVTDLQFAGKMQIPHFGMTIFERCHSCNAPGLSPQAPAYSLSRLRKPRSRPGNLDQKSTRLNSSHLGIS